MDPGDGSAPLPSTSILVARSGFGAPSQAKPDWGIRGERPINELSTETNPIHETKRRTRASEC